MTQTDAKAGGIRELSRLSGISLGTVRRRVAKWKLSAPFDVAEFKKKLEGEPPRGWRQNKSEEAPAAAPTPPPSSVSEKDLAIPSLEQLEREIRLAKDPVTAETLSKQVRSLKVLQEVMEAAGKTINADAARSEAQVVFTIFQSTLMGQIKTLVPSLFGLEPLELEKVLQGRFVELLGELRRGLENAVKPKVVAGDVERPDTPDDVVAEPVGGEEPENDPPAIEPAGDVEELEQPLPGGDHGFAVQATADSQDARDEDGAGGNLGGSPERGGVRGAPRAGPGDAGAPG